MDARLERLDVESTEESSGEMRTFRSAEMENVIGQLFRLEGRISQLEQRQEAARRSFERVRALDSVQQARGLQAMQNEYLADLDRVTAVKEGVTALRDLYDWRAFVGEARALGDPATYGDFGERLRELREEQKNGLKLPEIELLGNPYLTSFETLSTALGSKGETRERLAIERMLAILDFAMRADRQTEYIANEVAFAAAAAENLLARATDLQQRQYATLNLQPGPVDEAREDFFRYQFSGDFAREEGETLVALHEQARRLHNDYAQYELTLLHALQRADYGVEQLRASPRFNEMSDLHADLDARKEALRARITEATAALERHRGGNG